MKKIRRPPQLGVLEFCCASHISYLISHISHTHNILRLYVIFTRHNLLLSYLVLYSWGGVWGGGCRVHNQIGLNCASRLLYHTILAILFLLHLPYSWDLSILESSWPIWSCLKLCGAIWGYPQLYGTIWHYLELSGAIWNYLKLPVYLELSAAICSYLELSGAIWRFLGLYGATCSYLPGYLELSAAICSYL